MKPLFNKVVIIGLGLIGGSLGMALRRRRVARRVVGVDRLRSAMVKARAMGAIDGGAPRFSEAVAGADLVVIATPPASVVPTARRVARATRHRFLLTDVASVKGPIVAALNRELPSRISFVGGHPMAGSEQSGIKAADPELFIGAPCVVTRTAKTKGRALSSVRALWQSLGSKVTVLSPARHDALVAQVSHVPHLAAVGLTLIASPTSLNLAAGGFSDTTRIALSDPVLWRQICAMNRQPLADALDQFLIRLGQLRDLLTHENGIGLSRLLRAAQRRRQGL